MSEHKKKILLIFLFLTIFRKKVFEVFLYYSLKYGLVSFLSVLFSLGLSANFQFEDGSTLLHVWKIHPASITFLANHGFQTTQKNSFGETPLNFHLLRIEPSAGCIIGEPEIVKAILDAGASPNERNTSGQLPLNRMFNYPAFDDPMLMEKKRIMLELLIASATNLQVSDFNGETPLHWAIRPDVTSSTVELLIRRGVSIDAQDKHGRTPLHFCAQQGLASLTELLLGSGGRANLIDKTGFTPLDIANRGKLSGWKGMGEVVGVLKKNGGKSSLSSLNESSE